MQYEVLRAFEGAGQLLEPGMVVDTSTWRARNVEGLVNNRYLRPAGLAVPEGFDVKLERQSASVKRRYAPRKKNT